MRPLPSLNLFRGFLVIGRHLNLTRAADEIHLTTSALSHQLNLLEEALGVRLFARTGRGLAFTKAGKELHGEVEASLGRLERAARHAMGDGKTGVLVVNALPTFAMRWLLPRFATFGDANVEIRVSTLDIQFERDDVDCAIHYGHEHEARDERLIYEFLTAVDLIVVCAPSAVAPDRPLATPADLVHHPLLRARLSTRMADDWRTWLASAGVTPAPNQRELMLENRNLTIQAAQSGLGLAVVDPLMVQDELRSGKLVQPLAHRARAGGSYYLVHPRAAQRPARVAAFRDWLLAQIGDGGGSAAAP